MKKLQRDLSKITPKTYIIGLGDLLDSIIVQDTKRYAKSQDDTKTDSIIDEQIERMYNLLSPYKERIIGLHDGNHEEAIIRKCGTNPTKRLADLLETEYLGLSSLIRIVFEGPSGGNRNLIIRSHHGWGHAGRTVGGDLTKYSHDVKFWEADLFLYGHVHTLKSIDIDAGRMIGARSWRTIQRKMVICGTYQRTYSNDTTATYAERMGLPPVSIRSPEIFMRPWKYGVELKVEH